MQCECIKDDRCEEIEKSVPGTIVNNDREAIISFTTEYLIELMVVAFQKNNHSGYSSPLNL